MLLYQLALDCTHGDDGTLISIATTLTRWVSAIDKASDLVT